MALASTTIRMCALSRIDISDVDLNQPNALRIASIWRDKRHARAERTGAMSWAPD